MLALVLTAGASLALGCPKGDDAPQTTAVGASAEDDGKVDAGDDGFRARAHEQALERFVEASTKALRLAEPLAAHRLDPSVALGPPPLSRSARAPLREAVDAALQEGEGIDRGLLSAEQGMLYEAVWRGLSTIRRDLDRIPALRRDPTLFAWRSRPLVEHVVARVVTGRACEGCAAGLTALGSELAAAAGQLGATSPASLTAAQADLAALHAELTELAARDGIDAPIAEGANAAAQGVAAVQQRLTAIEAALADAVQVQWRTPVPGATRPEAVRRLPDRIGGEALAQRLTLEEQLRLTPEQVAAEITLMLLRLKTMAEAHAKTHGEARSTAASPPSTARCTAAWEPLATWAASNTALAEPVKSNAFDCAAGVAELGSDPMTDAALSLAVFELGILEPTRWGPTHGGRSLAGTGERRHGAGGSATRPDDLGAVRSGPARDASGDRAGEPAAVRGPGRGARARRAAVRRRTGRASEAGLSRARRGRAGRRGPRAAPTGDRAGGPGADRQGSGAGRGPVAVLVGAAGPGDAAGRPRSVRRRPIHRPCPSPR